jgi:hypothetical protein
MASTNWLAETLSIIAIATSMFTLGWSVYRDVRRPKLKISISINRIVAQGASASDRFISLSALNLGPIPNRVNMPYMTKSWLRRIILRDSWPHAVILPDYHHPGTSNEQQRTSRIEIGDSITFAFPLDDESFLSNAEYIGIGVTDGFGRAHFAPRRQLRELRRQFMAQRV